MYLVASRSLLLIEIAMAIATWISVVSSMSELIQHGGRVDPVGQSSTFTLPLAPSESLGLEPIVGKSGLEDWLRLRQGSSQRRDIGTSLRGTHLRSIAGLCKWRLLGRRWSKRVIRITGCLRWGVYFTVVA